MNGKEKEGRSWQQVVTNLELAKKYQEKDGAGYSDTLEKQETYFRIIRCLWQKVYAERGR